MRRVAILIDGGYLLRRLPHILPEIDSRDATKVCGTVERLIAAHLAHINKIVRAPHPRGLLYRAFFYGTPPVPDAMPLPVSGQLVDFAALPEARFQGDLHDALRRTPSLAVRWGDLRAPEGAVWDLRPDALQDLLDGRRDASELRDGDFRPTFRQTGVDVRIALDIATITLKQQADTIVLVTGDADFAPAAKLARREGLKVILDPLWHPVGNDLFEHIDGVYSGVPKPQRIDGRDRGAA